MGMVNTLLAIVSRYMEFDYNEKVFFCPHTVHHAWCVSLYKVTCFLPCLYFLKQVVTSTIELSVKSGD
jgi:hypothetical protein